MKQSQTLLNISGVMKVDITVYEYKKIFMGDVQEEVISFQKSYLGSAGSTNLKTNFSDAKNRAIKDAIFKFYFDKGEDLSRGYEVLKNNRNKITYKINKIYFVYFDEVIKLKRINKNGKYYLEARIKTKKGKGKVLSRRKWTNKKNRSDVEEDFYYEHY